MENKQTAVEWLVETLIRYNLVPKETNSDNVLFNKAKEMEKEQIIKSHCDGFYKSAEGWNGEYGLNDIDKICEEIKAEQYYTETYGNRTENN